MAAFTNGYQNKIKQLVRKNGLNQEELARSLEMGPWALSKFLNGESPRSIAWFYELLNVVGIDLDRIIDQKLGLLSDSIESTDKYDEEISQLIRTLEKVDAPARRTIRSTLRTFELSASATLTSPSNKRRSKKEGLN